MKNPTIFTKIFLGLFIASTAMAESGAISDEMAKKIFINMRKCTLEAEATGAIAIMEKKLNQNFSPDAALANELNKDAKSANKMLLANGAGIATSAIYMAFHQKFLMGRANLAGVTPWSGDEISSLSMGSFVVFTATSFPAAGNVLVKDSMATEVNKKIAQDLVLNKTAIQQESKRIAKELGYIVGINKTDEALLQDALYRRAFRIDENNHDEKIGDFLKSLNFGGRALLSNEQKNALDVVMQLEERSRNKTEAPAFEDAKIVPYLKACVNALTIKNAQAANKRTENTAKEVSSFLSELSTYARLNKLPDYYDTKQAEHNSEEAREAGKNVRAD